MNEPAPETMRTAHASSMSRKAKRPEISYDRATDTFKENGNPITFERARERWHSVDCDWTWGAHDEMVNYGLEDDDWKLWEMPDGTREIYPVGVDPDDLAFARQLPICIIPAGVPFKLAQLIAAAPNLLKTLRALIGKIEEMSGCAEVNCEAGHEECYPEFKAARAAIAKAEGAQ